MSFSKEAGPGVFPAETSIEPNPGLARSLGTLNIVFGAILLLCGLCSGISLLSMAFAGTMANQAQFQAQWQQAWKQARDQQLARLQQELDATKDAAVRQRIEARMAEIREASPPEVDFAAMYGIKDPAVVVFWSVELLSGIIFNLLLIVGGIGLLSLADWGRKLSIYVAVLKLVRLVGLYGYALLAVVPVMARDMAQAFHDMAGSVPENRGQEVPPVAEMAQGFGIAWALGLGVFAVLAVIYPLLMLFLLARPSVKAATRVREAPGFGRDAI